MDVLSKNEHMPSTTNKRNGNKDPSEERKKANRSIRSFCINIENLKANNHSEANRFTVAFRT